MFSSSVWARDKETIHASSRAPKKDKFVSCAGRVVASVYWDAKRVALIDPFPKGHTIDENYLASLVRYLRKSNKDEMPRN